MKSHMKLTAALLFAGILALGTTRNAEALGTPSGTDISNQATINFSVSGVAQTAVNSNTLTFKVDKKVNLNVVRQDGAIIQVAPGQTNAVITFTVTNQGNDPQDFSLAAIAEATGTADPFGAGNGTDNFDATLVGVYVESGVTALYQPAQDTATGITNLSATAGSNSKTVYVVVNIPSTRIDKDVSYYGLKATALALGGGALTQTAGADTAGVDIVFADGAGTDDIARDAAFSDRSGYKVVAPVLTIAKTSTVISDPANGISPNAKAIPGAIVEYTITITNANGSTGTATGITVSDSLVSEIATLGHLAFNTNAYASGKGIQVTAPNLYSGAATALTNASDGDEGNFTANVVTVSGINLAPNQLATVKFQVVVQ